MPRIRYPYPPHNKTPPPPSPDAIKAARKKVLKAMVERAPEVERQSKVIIEALRVMQRLQMEVYAKDKKGHATYRGGAWICDGFSNHFVPSDVRVTLDSMLQNTDRIILNARKLIADDAEKKKK